MRGQKKNLLFLVSDEQSVEKTSASATLGWLAEEVNFDFETYITCLLYTSPSPRDLSTSRMPSSA